MCVCVSERDREKYSRARGREPKGSYFILVQEHVQLLHRDAQVSLVELVGNVPAQRSKLLPLLGQRVEETQAVQQLLEHSLQQTPAVLRQASSKKQYVEDIRILIAIYIEMIN